MVQQTWWQSWWQLSGPSSNAAGVDPQGGHPDRAVETNRLAVHGGFVGHVGRDEPHRVTELIEPGLVGPWKVCCHRPRAICNEPTHGRKAER